MYRPFDTFVNVNRILSQILAIRFMQIIVYQVKEFVKRFFSTLHYLGALFFLNSCLTTKKFRTTIQNIDKGVLDFSEASFFYAQARTKKYSGFAGREPRDEQEDKASSYSIIKGSHKDIFRLCRTRAARRAGG